MEVIRGAMEVALEGREAVAVVGQGKCHSYAQLLASALHLCFSLTKCQDLQKTSVCSQSLEGVRIGILAKPCAEFVTGLWATWLCGGIAVPLALNHPESELLHVLSDAGVSLVLGTQEHKEKLQGVAKKCSADFHLLPDIPTCKQSDKTLQEASLCTADIEGKENFAKVVSELSRLCSINGEKSGLIVYTSGTTGKSKGVVHTHSSMAAQVKMLSKAWGFSKTDGFLHCLPLHRIHTNSRIVNPDNTKGNVHGLFVALLAPLYAGAMVEFLPKFSVRGIWSKWCESYPAEGPKSVNPITVFTGVPTMYVRLLQGYESMDEDSRKASVLAAQQLRLMDCSSGACERNWSSYSLIHTKIRNRLKTTQLEKLVYCRANLRLLRKLKTLAGPMQMCASSTLPQSIMVRWEKLTGHQLNERYGMTEFVTGLSNPLQGERRLGTVGKPLPGVQVKILYEDNTTGAGELYEDNAIRAGELCVKSPGMFKEYWNQPKITKESFLEDGFFRTGDIATIDEDGYYIILGRSSIDILKVGGYKISALEIEGCLLEHPSISECVVLGVPDICYGEAICAIVVPTNQGNIEAQCDDAPVLTLDVVRNWAGNRLAPYKLPTQLRVFEEIPKNAMGKVNKKELKQLVMKLNEKQ